MQTPLSMMILYATDTSSDRGGRQIKQSQLKRWLSKNRRLRQSQPIKSLNLWRQSLKSSANQWSLMSSSLAAACWVICSYPFASARAIGGNDEFMVCVVEKGSEFGAHTLSGAVIEPRALNELIPDWKEKGAPLKRASNRRPLLYLNSATRSTKVPDSLIPAPMHNNGNYIVSLGNVVRWLAVQAEELKSWCSPGFPADDIFITMTVPYEVS